MRTLLKDRRFSLLAVFALALGIGASTVVFSIVYDGLLNPFPYKDAEGISVFQIHDMEQSGNRGRGAFTFPEFLDYREQNQVFADMVGTAYTDVLYSSNGGTQQAGCLRHHQHVSLSRRPTAARPMDRRCRR